MSTMSCTCRSAAVIVVYNKKIHSPKSGGGGGGGGRGRATQSESNVCLHVT